MTQSSDSHEGWPLRLSKTRHLLEGIGSHIRLGANASHMSGERHGIPKRPDFIHQPQTTSVMHSNQLFTRQQRTDKDAILKGAFHSRRVLIAGNDGLVQPGTTPLEAFLAKRTHRRTIPGKRHEFKLDRAHSKLNQHSAETSGNFALFMRSREERDRENEVENRVGNSLAQTSPDSGVTGGGAPGTSKETGDPLDKSGVSQENRIGISSDTKHLKTLLNKEDASGILCRSRVSFVIFFSLSSKFQGKTSYLQLISYKDDTL